MDILPNPRRRFGRKAADAATARSGDDGSPAAAPDAVEPADDSSVQPSRPRPLPPMIDPDTLEPVQATREPAVAVDDDPPIELVSEPDVEADAVPEVVDAPEPAPAATRAAARSAGQKSRAGRNLPAAIGVGAVLGGLVIASLFVRKEAFVAVCTLAIVVAVWELTDALGTRGINVPLVPVAVGAVGMEVSAFAAGGQALAVCLALTCLGVVVWRVAEGPEGAVRDVAGGVLVAAYAPLLAGFAMLMLSPDDGPWRVLTFIVATIASDTGGYAAGVLFGRHPMAPSVSPKKSWEGFAGSVLACLVAGVAMVTLALDGPWWAGLLVGAAAVVFATGGDLAESLIKRDLGIKDMGSLLPGHGGVLDRLDSLVFVAPVVYLILHAFVPVS